MRSCALVRSVLTTHPYVKILRHVRFLTISTQSDQGNGRALSFRVGAGLRRTAKSCHQCCQTGAVFLSQCGEFSSEPAARLYMPDNNFGPDLFFLNEKVKPDRVHFTRLFCFDKQTSHTQVSDF